MADNDMSFRQRAVIEFLIKEEIPAAEVHQRLQRAYGCVCMGAERVDEIIQDDRRVTVDTIARKLGLGHNAAQEMIESLGYRKVCARWVRHLLTEDHKGKRKAITSELLQRCRHDGGDFLLRIVTSDESWFHHFEPETKRQCMGWLHLHSPSKKKAKTVPSAAKVMGTVFWDAEGLILAEFLEPGQTITAARYVQTLHCAINVRDETSSSCMTTLAHMPLASHRKQLQRWGGKFFHTPPIALIWHPPTTIFSDL